MPTKAVSAETMEVGHKGRGKHWTKAEVAARQAAAQELERQEPQALTPPEWLKTRERAIWDQVLEKAKDVQLFDTLDRETLAVYCSAVAEYEKCASRKRRTVDAIKEQQAWARIISTLGDKLGLNPSARARLIKKKAEKSLDQFAEDFD